jgi:hypothetical protein
MLPVSDGDSAGKELAMEFILVFLAVAACVLLFVGLRRGLETYAAFRGERLITCPENHKTAAVRVAAGKAALEATLGNEQLRLSACSRWPEKKGCGQECLSQIEVSPKTCLVSTIVNDWYQGKSCAYCHKPFGEIHWHDHPPALVDKERKTFQWNGLPVDKLQEVMNTALPVCWNCHVAESFRREHPELVVDRPASHSRLTVLH